MFTEIVSLMYISRAVIYNRDYLRKIKENQVSVDTVRNQILQCTYTWRTSVLSSHEMMGSKVKFMGTFVYEMWKSKEKKATLMWTRNHYLHRLTHERGKWGPKRKEERNSQGPVSELINRMRCSGKENRRRRIIGPNLCQQRKYFCVLVTFYFCCCESNNGRMGSIKSQQDCTQA